MLPFGSSLYHPIAYPSNDVRNIQHHKKIQSAKKSSIFVINRWMWSSRSINLLYSKSFSLTHLLGNFSISKYISKASRLPMIFCFREFLTPPFESHYDYGPCNLRLLLGWIPKDVNKIYNPLFLLLYASLQ